MGRSPNGVKGGAVAVSAEGDGGARLILSLSCFVKGGLCEQGKGEDGEDGEARRGTWMSEDGEIAKFRISI